MKKKKWFYSGTTDRKVSMREKKHGRLARELATEGIVLLKNEKILPISKKAGLALFGSGAEKTVKGGIGSGDVNNRDNISIYQGLIEEGVSITSKVWIKDYEERYHAARENWKNKIYEDTKKYDNPFDAYAANPFSMPEGRRITADDLVGADVAVYVVSRISGEGKDRRRVEGDYYLSQEEKDNLFFLNQEKIPTILLINAGGPVELTEIVEKAPFIQGILNISQLGQEGGRAVADILLGRANPSGRLTATWARHYEDYPMAESFGYLNGNLESEEYKENIYVGYRYFDTFQIPVLFPFGYGLSYTTFEKSFKEIRFTKDEMEIDVAVKNSGNQFSGKEVVEIYAGLPKDGKDKESLRLIGFAKTKELQPKEVQILTIQVETKSLASFSEMKNAWLIDVGMYDVYIGDNSQSLQIVARLKVTNAIILEETIPMQNACADFSDKLIAHNLQQKEIISEDVPEYSLKVMQSSKKNSTKDFYAKDQSVQELIPLFYGNITQGASTLGSAGIRVPGSAGETTEKLEEKYGKRSLIMADGPAGIRLRQSYDVDRTTGKVYGAGVFGSLENGFLEPVKKHNNADTYYQYCTAFPVGTAVAQTWSAEMAERFGQAVAEEMEEYHVDIWLAPGINIQRNPLCGRNFEYYSEDPIIAGSIAAAVTKGVQSKEHCGVTVKHFACNNQEDHRMGVDVRVSERALREIYLRGFEIAVKRSSPVALMTSYNRINGIYAANNYDICTNIARKEWSFEGIIMSDWNTTVPEDGSTPWKCIAAGNDIIMPGNPEDDNNIRTAYEQGLLSEQMIRECAGRIIETIERFG